MPTTRARPCSVTPAIPSARASVQADATISAVLSARRFATEFAIVSRSDRQRPVGQRRGGGRPPGHRRPPSPAGHPQGEPLDPAGPGGRRRDQPSALRLGEQFPVPAVHQSASHVDRYHLSPPWRVPIVDRRLTYRRSEGKSISTIRGIFSSGPRPRRPGTPHDKVTTHVGGKGGPAGIRRTALAAGAAALPAGASACPHK